MWTYDPFFIVFFHCISSECFDTPVYRPVWAKAEHFAEIRVNPKMLRDHLPDVVLKALKETAKETGEVRHALLQLRNVQTDNQ